MKLIKKTLGRTHSELLNDPGMRVDARPAAAHTAARDGRPL